MWLTRLLCLIMRKALSSKLIVYKRNVVDRVYAILALQSRRKGEGSKVIPSVISSSSKELRSCPREGEKKGQRERGRKQASRNVS